MYQAESVFNGHACKKRSEQQILHTLLGGSPDFLMVLHDMTLRASVKRIVCLLATVQTDRSVFAHSDVFLSSGFSEFHSSIKPY